MSGIGRRFASFTSVWSGSSSSCDPWRPSPLSTQPAEASRSIMESVIEHVMGDQNVGYFVPLYAPAYARTAIETGLAVLRATGHGAGKQPWVPVGIGVYTGDPHIGTVGRGSGLVELTAIGEDVNVAARLASVAAAGELVTSEAAYAAAGIDRPAESREVTLKGVSQPVRVRVMRAD